MKKLTLLLNQRDVEALDAAKERSGIRTYSEMIRFLINQYAKGN